MNSKGVIFHHDNATPFEFRNPYDFWIVPTFKRQVSQFHDNLTFSSEVREVLVKQLLSFSKFQKPEKSIIIDWYDKFKRGRTKTDDAERSGRPKSSVVPENITKVHKIVLGDRKLKLRKILNIWEGGVFIILHESLGMRKLFSKWVSRLLISDQKQQR